MLGTKKLNEKDSSPVVEQDGVRYLVGDKKKKARREGGVLRVVGNVLIAVGLMMLLGIGGWYGYSSWANAEYVKQAESTWGPGTYEPPINATPNPTQPPLPTPLPVLVTQQSIESGGPKTEVAFPTLVKIEDASPPTRLTIPSVGIDQPVVPVGWSMIPAPGGGVKSEWDVADFAVGHHKGSVNPGQRGNVVMSGHVDYKGEVFRNLHKVSKGDEIILHTEKGQYIYVATDLKIVREEGVSDEQKRANARFMNQTPDRTLTLITCHPYGIDTHRLIVIAKPYQSALSTQSEFTLR
jgi:sortase A